MQAKCCTSSSSKLVRSQLCFRHICRLFQCSRKQAAKRGHMKLISMKKNPSTLYTLVAQEELASSRLALLAWFGIHSSVNAIFDGQILKSPSHGKLHIIKHKYKRYYEYTNVNVNVNVYLVV